MQMKITLKIKPDYTCRICGIQREGTDTYTLEDIYSANELQRILINFVPPRRGIPIGWSSNGTLGVECNNCKGV